MTKPVNVLAQPGLTFAEIIGAGAQRVSVGGALTWVAVERSRTRPRRFATTATSRVLATRLRLGDWLSR